MNCSNCEKPLSTQDHVDAILVLHHQKECAVVCPECCKDVRTLKIVLHRLQMGHAFKFDGILPAEMFKSAT